MRARDTILQRSPFRYVKLFIEFHPKNICSHGNFGVCVLLVLGPRYYAERAHADPTHRFRYF